MGLLSADDEADVDCRYGAVERVPVLPYRPDSEFTGLLDNGTEQQMLLSPSMFASSNDLEPRPSSLGRRFVSCVIFYSRFRWRKYTELNCRYIIQMKRNNVQHNKRGPEALQSTCCLLFDCVLASISIQPSRFSVLHTRCDEEASEC